MGISAGRAVRVADACLHSWWRHPRHASMPPSARAAGSPLDVAVSRQPQLPNVPPWLMAACPAAIGCGGMPCCHRLRRHVPRVGWPTCRHVTFAICIQRWSFLVFHWGRWSDLSKFQHFDGLLASPTVGFNLVKWCLKTWSFSGSAAFLTCSLLVNVCNLRVLFVTLLYLILFGADTYYASDGIID